MGNYNTKNEEIVIAQQGANHVRQVGDMERKIETYGIIVIIVAIILVLLFCCLCSKHCIKYFRKTVRNELAEAGLAVRADLRNTTPQTNYQV